MKPLYVKKDGTVQKVSGIGMPATYPAENTSYDNTTSGLTADDVQGAIDELAQGGGGGGGTAATTTYDNTDSGLTATNVQDAIDELVTDMPSDEKVKQSPSTTNSNYEVLLSGSADNTEHTEGVNKSTTLRFNPSTGSLMQGTNTTASGTNSHAEGNGSSALGNQSHAEGNITCASGTNSHSEGYGSSASGSYAHAEGGYSYAVESGAHSEGINTSALGVASHAEGGYVDSTHKLGTCASGASSHAEGYNTLASGNYSHAEGISTTAAGTGSHASGAVTCAAGQYQTVMGKYNIVDSTSLLIVGNGDSTTRKNAMYVDSAGNIIAANMGNKDYGVHNADNSIISGDYYYSSNGPLTSLGASTNDGALYVQAYSSSWVGQIAQDYRNGNLFVRGKNNNSWQAWKRVSMNDDEFICNSNIVYDQSAKRVTKIGSTTAWDAQLYSKIGYTNNVYVSFRASTTDKMLMIGLNSDPTTDAGYESIDYALYLKSDGTFQIYESGTVFDLGTISYSAGDHFSIEYSNGTLCYYKNHEILRRRYKAVGGSSTAANRLYLDSSFYNNAASVSCLEFGQLAHFVNPYNNRYNMDVSASKYYKIRIENLQTNWMLTFTITVYAGYRYCKFQVTGYRYGGQHWYSDSSVDLISTSYRNGTPIIANKVYLGYDSDNTLWVGFGAGAYTGILVDSACNGFKDIGDLTSIFNIIQTGDDEASLGGTVQQTLVFGSHAEGINTTASGVYSHAEGQGSSAPSSTSHAEGYGTTSSGTGAHTEGYMTRTGTDYAHAEGYNSSATGVASHAEGGYLSSTDKVGNIASGNSSHAEGYNTTASGNVAHAEGKGTSAYGQAAHAEGNQTVTQNTCAHAEGCFATASGSYSHAEGGYINSSNKLGVIASGVCAHAEGYNTIASGSVAHAEGHTTCAHGQNSHAEGQNTTATGQGSHSEGYYTIVSNHYSHAEGGNTTASGSYAHAEGGVIDSNNKLGNTAASVGSHAEGYNTTTGGTCSHSEGMSTYAQGARSHAEGNQSTSAGSYSHAEGSLNITAGNGSHAEGYTTYASGNQAHSEGGVTSARADYSHAEGGYTYAAGGYSHAEGRATTTSSGYSHAEGYATCAASSYSHTEGYGTRTATGSYAHAEGYATCAVGQNAHSEGAYTSAIGNGSHAEGNATTAGGHNSHAEGLGTCAAGQYQTVMGKYNVADTTSLFIIGNGTAANTKSNALTVDADGLMTVKQSKSTVDKSMLTGTGTAAQDKGSGVSPRYFPAKWTFNTGITVADGDMFTIKIPVAGHSYGEFISVNNGTDYYPVGYNTNTLLTTHFPVGAIITVVFKADGVVNSIYPVAGGDAKVNVSGGAFYVQNLYDSGNSNTYDRNKYVGAIKCGTTAIVAGNIIVGKDGVFHHLKDGTAFDITYPILYANSAIAANATGTDNYDIIHFTKTTTQSGNITAYLPVYIQGTLSGTTFTPVSTTPLTQTVPTSYDGYVYIYLGNATAATTIYLQERHPIYKFYSGVFREYSDSEGTGLIASGFYSHAEGQSTTASGDCSHSEGYHTSAGASSHAEGYSSVASGSRSHAEGQGTKATASYSHAEGFMTTASNSSSHAEGDNAIASGNRSHAEGYKTTASGTSSHAEGYCTSASDTSSHAEGYYTSASGSYAHAEGETTIASGSRSHTEGYKTTGFGNYSHAEGYCTSAKEDTSHTEGAYTTAQNKNAHASGHYNAAMTSGGSATNTTGTAFVIGNGTGASALKNAFSVQFSGVVKAASTITASTTADYGEYFEWADENPNNEDRVGYFVTFDSGDKIKIGSPTDDYILGIVSGEPFVLGNGDCDVWNGMVMRDDFRRTIYEPAPKMEILSDGTQIPVRDKDGNIIYEGTKPKYNPNYDPTQPYINRADRPEWSAVGMLGVLAVRDNGQCQINSYCTVGQGGIAVPANINSINKYRVIKRNAANVIEVVFR